VIFNYVPHPHIRHRREQGPVKVSDQIPPTLNGRIGLRITAIVGTMWCAYIFAAIAIYGLPAALKPNGEGLVAWIAQTFLQLVLLSVIMVGQSMQSQASDKRSQQTYDDAEAVLHEAMQIQAHLAEQDTILENLVSHVRGMHE
jgi:hypothetical protein